MLRFRRSHMWTSVPVLVAAAPDKPTGLVAVAVPEPIDPDGSDMPDGELHVTLGYFGDASATSGDTIDALKSWVDDNRGKAFTARVSGVARMGNDDPQAIALLVEASELNDLRTSLMEVAQPDMTHPHFTPHMTIGYGIDMPDRIPEEITLKGVELWIAGEHYTGMETA